MMKSRLIQKNYLSLCFSLNPLINQLKTVIKLKIKGIIVKRLMSELVINIRK